MPERAWPRDAERAEADRNLGLWNPCPFNLESCVPPCHHRFGQRPPPTYLLLEKWEIEIPAVCTGEDNTYLALLHALGWATRELESRGVKIPKLDYPRWEGRRYVTSKS